MGSLRGLATALCVAVLLCACAAPEEAAPVAEASPLPEPSAEEPADEQEPTEAPTGEPSPTAPTDPSPTTEPSPAAATGPTVDPALDTVPRLVVVDGGDVWVRTEDRPWRRIGSSQDVTVIGDGRWWYHWQADDAVLRSLDDDAVTCEPPTGFLDPTSYWTVVHESGLTTVFVAPTDGGEVSSVVCEDPDRPTPLTDWEPPRDGEDGRFGPIILYDDGVRLELLGDAEGNVTVLDPDTGDTLIEYAISGPYVDAGRGLLVHVDIDGGMHFAGGTLVVSGLDGTELRRTDLGGPSVLAGIADGRAYVERVALPEFDVTHHVIVDLTTGEVVLDVPSTLDLLYVGP